MINVQCSQCGASFNVMDTLAGSKGKCPKCKAVIRVPNGQPTSEQPAASTASASTGGGNIENVLDEVLGTPQPGAKSDVDSILEASDADKQTEVIAEGNVEQIQELRNVRRSLERLSGTIVSESADLQKFLRPVVGVAWFIFVTILVQFIGLILYVVVTLAQGGR